MAQYKFQDFCHLLPVPGGSMSAQFCQHIHLICNDLEAMIAFWEKGFGAKLLRRREFRGAFGAIMDINAGAKLYLKSVPCQRADEGEPRAGIEHLGMQVADLEKTVADLQQMPDVSVVRGPFMSETRRCYFIKGPEGILVEVMQETVQS